MKLHLIIIFIFKSRLCEDTRQLEYDIVWPLRSSGWSRNPGLSIPDQNSRPLSRIQNSRSPVWAGTQEYLVGPVPGTAQSWPELEIARSCRNLEHLSQSQNPRLSSQSQNLKPTIVEYKYINKIKKKYKKINKNKNDC